MVTIYTNSFCPFCAKAKGLLDSLDVKYKDVDITDSQEVLDDLSLRSGLKTVPQIYVGEKFLGGYSDIQELHDKGELMDKLKEGQ